MLLEKGPKPRFLRADPDLTGKAEGKPNVRVETCGALDWRNKKEKNEPFYYNTLTVLVGMVISIPST